MSGVTVHTIMASSSDAAIPRWHKASRPAATAISDVAMSLSAICRSRIPVRSTIHLSFVSTIFDRSSFVRIPGGTKQPRAVILAVGNYECPLPNLNPSPDLKKEPGITMLQLVKMQVETALFFETVEQIYQRVFRTLKPRTPLPEITVRFRKYANANSRIRLEDGQLMVDISDLLEGAPAPIQEALALILISKLFRRSLDGNVVARYRRYLNRADVRRTLHLVKQERGRKSFLNP